MITGKQCMILGRLSSLIDRIVLRPTNSDPIGVGYIFIIHSSKSISNVGRPSLGAKETDAEVPCGHQRSATFATPGGRPPLWQTDGHPDAIF